MAQAARLNLRMQKELKLLLTDPPPGASFPSLSSSSSLSSLLAQIEGPEGTVYANGVFKINVQIPERYPFQPPIVTFATPIYHPNIDNGGRICLDILNLPPKGAWQPSLNISTVLTSIGLLLSEPNPDDGLMLEVSKEYKYNRQAFDQKARSMTEKYAKAGASEIYNVSQSTENHVNSRMMEAKGSVSEVSECEVNENFGSHKKVCGISTKLSLALSIPNMPRDSAELVNEVHITPPSENQMEVERPKQLLSEKSNDYCLNHEKLHGTRQKLSLESVGPSQTRSGDDKQNVVPNQCSSVLNPQSISKGPAESRQVLQASNCDEQQPHEDRECNLMSERKNISSENLSLLGREQLLEASDFGQRRDDTADKLHTFPQLLPSQSHFNVAEETLPMNHTVTQNEIQCPQCPTDKTGNSFSNIKRKKLGLAGRKLSFGISGSSQIKEKRNKENVAPIKGLLIAHPDNLTTTSSMSSLTQQAGELDEGITVSCDANTAHKKLCGIRGKLPLEPPGQLQGSNNEKPSAKPSKSLPVLQDCRYDEKQQSKQDHNEYFGGGIEEQEGGSPLPEAMIVLDSEDSEGERDVSLRSKLSLARKPFLGKRKA